MAKRRALPIPDRRQLPIAALLSAQTRSLASTPSPGPSLPAPRPPRLHLRQCPRVPLLLS
eukprot:13716370-Alexandrium_andersonii.AAC.1